MLTNIKSLVHSPWRIGWYALADNGFRLDGLLRSPWWVLLFFAQSPLGFCSGAARAWTLCSRSSREGSSFLFHEEKKRSKENSPSALFCLLQHFSPLNKKNSLRSDSFLFFTLRKAPPLHGKKVRPDLYAFFMQHRFARWGVMFFFLRFVYFVIQTIPLSKNQKRFSMSVANNGAKRSEGSRVHPHHERSDVPSLGGLLRPQWRSVKKNRVFSVKNEKLFERSEFFSFRKICGFFSSGA